MLSGPFCHRGDPQPKGCSRCRYYVTRATPAERAKMDAETGRAPAPRVAKPSPSPPVALPCVHEGPVIESCKVCNKERGELRHVRACLHPSPSDEDRDACTRGYVSDKVQSCDRCPDRVSPIVPDQWEAARELVAAKPTLRPKGWATSPDVQRAHQIAADAFLFSLPEYPAGRYAGRGVVIVGGGKYWPGVYVTVRMLRHVGCTLPVQVWHLGDAERDDRYVELLAPLGVEVVGALAHPAAKSCRSLTGFPDCDRQGTHPPFEAKSFAVLHSPFEEVLSLDADNYPCADPTALFADPRYRATGAAFWPDLPHTNGWTHWGHWGVKRRGQDAGLEVGQYLVNKRTAWRPLSLWRWYDDHGDWCYGWGSHHDHGDKGPPRVAFAKLDRDYAMFSTVAVWQGSAFVQPGPDGKTPMFTHRCRSKFTLDPATFGSTPQRSAPNVRCGTPLEAEAFGYLNELRGALR